ncbi:MULTISPECIES: MFS transporter [Streptomyces]|uniref:MFS transporter n=1 Tax=Streptomyces TaxID=1883 RepID=UPI00037C702B|nr:MULTISPECIES: MFS transporter [Streptomyces]MBE8477425.1 MFS transporter [Streptomyces justiciae]
MSLSARTPVPLPRTRWTILIPIVFVTYGLHYLDRTNTAQLFPHVDDDIPMSDTATGLAQGAAFIGYMLLQLPAVRAAHRFGPRRVVFWCMILWGLAATGTGLVQNMPQLVAMRFLLGLAEGPLIPLVILLLSRYFVSAERARSAAWFLLVLPITQVLGAPLTGLLLEHLNWRTVFLIEGLPPLVWAFVWLFVAADTPDRARWLKRSEGAAVTERVAAEEAVKAGEDRMRLALLVRQRLVWVLAALYFAGTGGSVGLILWLPTIIEDLSPHATPLEVGTMAALPSLVGAIAVVLAARWSDAHDNRRTPMLMGFGMATTALLVGTQLPDTLWAHMTVLAVAGGAVISTGGVLASIPGAALPPAAAAGALAVGNSFGAIGQFLGALLIGALRDATDGSRTVSYAVIAAMWGVGLAASALIPEPARAAASKAKASGPQGSLA